MKPFLRFNTNSREVCLGPVCFGLRESRWIRVILDLSGPSPKRRLDLGHRRVKN